MIEYMLAISSRKRSLVCIILAILGAHVIRSHSQLRARDWVHIGDEIVPQRDIDRAVPFLPLSLSCLRLSSNSEDHSIPNCRFQTEVQNFKIFLEISF